MTDNPLKILIINSEIKELATVKQFVNELFIENNIAQKYFNKVFLCLSEAVVNSIEHGNKKDSCKKVSIYANYATNIVTLKISDEGKGFNLNKIVDPTNQENIRKESGRGIHIIKSLSEQVKYNHQENSIQFKIDCK